MNEYIIEKYNIKREDSIDEYHESVEIRATVGDRNMLVSARRFKPFSGNEWESWEYNLSGFVSDNREVIEAYGAIVSMLAKVNLPE